MSPQDVVRNRYPGAEACFESATFAMGQQAPIQEARWVVYSLGGLGHSPIATAASEELAWQAAAAKVQKEEPPADSQR